VIAEGIQTMEKSDQETLEKCWVDSENGLYGRNPSLDGEWCDQAERLAGRIDLPAIKVWAPLKPKNLFPWIAALLFLFVAVEPVGAQEINKEQAKEEKTKKEDPIQLYKTGNFSEAENVWREKVVANPRDPVARNNLALAYFQLGDKERALAYGLSAYLISPGTASVSWNTRIFAQSADQLDRAVMGLWSERSREWITGRLGVFGWQLAFVLGVTILAVGWGFGLGSGYFSQNRTLFVRVGIATFAIGLMLLVAASTALGIYGKLADRNAVMIVDVEPLRSIPTEAEAQAEKAYPPGSIARLEKSFLGWSKIRLPNQDAGWIRSEHIVSLY
jgi:tetratricopeptide (TPR) repeat protein